MYSLRRTKRQAGKSSGAQINCGKADKPLSHNGLEIATAAPFVLHRNMSPSAAGSAVVIFRA
jgi:hypothetical protein